MKKYWNGKNEVSNINRSWKYCPRCNHKSINRDLNKCLDCGGRVVWPIQECLIAYLDRRKDDWYMWYKGIGGTQGWYHSSFFRN